jgi:hypothetical protein
VQEKIANLGKHDQGLDDQDLDDQELDMLIDLLKRLKKNRN